LPLAIFLILLATHDGSADSLTETDATLVGRMLHALELIAGLASI
jgi:hypothetical protein